MESTIRICQFFDIKTSSDSEYRFQNYFIGQRIDFNSRGYNFAPFQVQGGISNLNGDNDQVQILFPAIEYAIRLVEEGNGNRLSVLTLYTLYVNEDNTFVNTNFKQDHLVGIGASFSEDTVELRFRSALDAVVANLPARSLNEANAGILPIDSQLNLR